MSISREQVEKVSLMVRLLRAEKELDKMTRQLVQLLAYMVLLAEVETEQVYSLAHALEVSNVFRDDEVRPSLDRHQVLANAPSHDNECYLVPAVLGEL